MPTIPELAALPPNELNRRLPATPDLARRARALAGSDEGLDLARALVGTGEGLALARALAGSGAGRDLALDLAKNGAGRGLARALAGSVGGRVLARALAGSVGGLALARALAGSVGGRALARDLAKSGEGLALARALAESGAGRALARDLAESGEGRGLARDLAGSVEGRGLALALAGSGVGLALALALAGSGVGLALARALARSGEGRDLARDLARSVEGLGLARDLAGSVGGLGLARDLAESGEGRALARALAESVEGRALALALAESGAGRTLAVALTDSDEGRTLAVALTDSDEGRTLAVALAKNNYDGQALAAIAVYTVSVFLGGVAAGLPLLISGASIAYVTAATSALMDGDHGEPQDGTDTDEGAGEPTDSDHGPSGLDAVAIEPVDPLLGIDAVEFQRHVETLLNAAQRLLDQDQINDPLIENRVRTDSQWLHDRVMTADIEAGIGMAAAAPIAIELADLVNRYAPPPSPEHQPSKTLSDRILDVATQHAHNSPEIVDAIAQEVEQANDGKVSAVQVKRALAAAGTAGGATALAYDIGLEGMVTAGGVFFTIAIGLIAIVRLMWHEEPPRGPQQ